MVGDIDQDVFRSVKDIQKPLEYTETLCSETRSFCIESR
jgi:hypothetical protein